MQTLVHQDQVFIEEVLREAKICFVGMADTDYYHRLMKSYNIPEFITGEVKNRIRAFSQIAKEDPGINVRFAQ